MRNAHFCAAICALSLVYGAGCKSYVDAVEDGPGVGDLPARTGASDVDSGSGGGEAPTGTLPNGCPADDAPPLEPEVVVAGKGGSLTVDESWIFFGYDAPVPYRVPTCGGEPELVAPADSIPDTHGASLLATDATYVYWVTTVGTAQDYAVYRAPKTGGTPELVTNEVAPNQGLPAALALDDAFVYLAEPDLYNSNNGVENLRGVVRRVPKAGGPVEVLSSTFTTAVAVDSSHVYWTQKNLDYTNSLIRANKDGSDAATFVTELGDIETLTTFGDRLYWTVFDAGVRVLRTSESGGSPLSVAATDEQYVVIPAAADDAAYWLRPGNATSGAIVRAELDGTLTELANAPTGFGLSYTDITYPPRLAVNATGVFWSYEPRDVGAPRIYRVAR